MAPAVAAPRKPPARVTDARRSTPPDRFTYELARRQALLARYKGSAPEAITALLGLLGELGGEVEPQGLWSFVQAVHADSRRSALVRSYAGMLLAQLAESAGRTSEAQARLSGEGFLLDWQIIGPFENVGRAGEDAVYPPEQEPYGVDAAVEGKLAGEPLQWRPWQYLSLPRGGYVALDDLLRPSEEAVGYATTWVYVPRHTKAAVHLGSSGPYKIWINDMFVGGNSAYRSPDPLQDTHAAVLAEGWNRVLIKLATLDNMWGFYARISDPSGAPLVDWQQQGDAPSEGSIAAGRVAGHHVASLGEQLRARQARNPLPLVEFYRYVHPFDKGDRTPVELARQVDSKLASVRSAWLLAIIDPDANGARAAMQAGIARGVASVSDAPLRGQLLLELAWRQRALGLETSFEELLAEAASVAPEDPIIALAQADRLAERGLSWSALRRNQDLARRFPASETVQHNYAARLAELGRRRAAVEVFDSIGRRQGGQGAAMLARIELLLDLGEPERAVALAQRAAHAMEGLPEAHAEVARLQVAMGDLDAAVASLARATALAPQDAEFHDRLGRLLARTGARTAAVASLRRSLELRPQQPAIRDLLASLDQGQSSDLLARYGLSLEEVGAWETPASWAGAQVGILHQRTAVRVLANGLTERLEHRIIRILDDRGVRSQAIQALAFDPAESVVEIRRARVRRRDGTVEDFGDRRMMGLASPGYRMYYDQRQLEVLFPGLRVGDTLEVAFFRRDIAARNMFDQYFGDLVAVSGTEPRKRVEYILEAPSDKPIYFNMGIEQALSKDGVTRTYRYRAEDVPAIKPEHGMPGWSEVALFLHASTYRTWDEVGRWYWGLVEEQLLVDQELREAVVAAQAGLAKGADTRSKVAAIYAWVVRNTRYVGLEFGIHGYKPYRTTDVLRRRFGDCKDKASLLKVMLREAGIASELVLVRTRDQGSLPGSPASLAAFNHAIVYVPSIDLYLDGTAEWAGPDELPVGDQGATVLRIHDGAGAELTSIPISTAADNVQVMTATVQLQRDGAALLRQTQEVKGAGAPGVRYAFQAPAQRLEQFQKLMGQTYVGATVRSVSVEEPSDILRPVTLTSEVAVSHWAQGPSSLRFRVLGRASELTGSMAPQDRRTYDLLLDAPRTESTQIDYTVPTNMAFTQVPSSRQLVTPFGEFELSVVSGVGSARVSSRLQLRQQRIAPAQYPAFREFLREVDAALEQTFTYEVQQ